MTLRQFIDQLGENPYYVIFFFLLIPLTALLAGIFGRNEGHISPWKYLYSLLIYLVSIPGIFAVTLSIYLFLFERRSIFDTDIYTQVLPILSMIITLLLIRRNVDLDLIPGFGKLSGLVIMIAAVLILMWMVDRTRIFVFSYMPFQQVLLIFGGLLLVAWFGWNRLFGGSRRA
ncbi:MAG: hypothetical protein AAF990_03915 [Bacteroidota bacterium]